MKPLCPKEVAEQLGVSPRTAQRLLSSGTIGAMRVGAKLWRTTQEELNRYVAAQWHREASPG